MSDRKNITETSGEIDSNLFTHNNKENENDYFETADADFEKSLIESLLFVNNNSNNNINSNVRKIQLIEKRTIDIDINTY